MPAAPSASIPSGRSTPRSTPRFAVETVHLGANRPRAGEAEAASVASVPALVIGGTPLHINFGASLVDVKEAA